MNPFTIAFDAVVPIFMLIALGYLARSLDIIDDVFVNQATKFVFRLSLPLLVFSKVASIDITEHFDSSYILLMVYCAVAIAIGYYLSKIAGSFLLKKHRTPRGYALGSFIQGGFRSNFLIIGYPVLLNLYGDDIVLSVALLTLVIVPMANILAIVALTPADQKTGTDKMKEIAVNIVKNPLMIAIALGFLSMALGFEFSKDYPIVVASFISMAGSLATPLGLVAIGAFFRFDGFKEQMMPTVAAAGVKLVLIPAVVSVIAYLIGMDLMSILTITVLLGGPSAVSSFAMSNELGGDAMLAGNIVILSSALCVLTYIGIISTWLSILS